MPPDVVPNLKPDPELCSCGCGVIGRPRVKAWRDGLAHNRNCRCRRCTGSLSNKSGHRKQGKALRGIGAPRAVRNEENVGGGVRTEAKSGKADTGPVWTRFLLSEKQSEQNRPIGDLRPFVALFMPDGTSDGLVVFRLSAIAVTVQALYEQLLEDVG